MNIAELDRLLLKTLEDPELTRTEKHYLTDWIRRNVNTTADYTAARARVLAVAQQQFGAIATPVVQWLAGVLELLQPSSDISGAAFFSPGTTCVQQLIREFNTAKHSCDVCVFTITDNRITEAIEAAHRRGVVLRVVTDDDKSTDHGSDIRRLVDAGIPCKTDRTLAHMHHKFAIFDNKRLVTGSFNWTRSASEQNEENLIVTPDPALVTAFLGCFEKLWAKFEDYNQG